MVKDVEEVMVIGGGAIYSHCQPFSDRLYVTHIDAEIEGDTQFPEYDTENQWMKSHSTVRAADEKNAYELGFCVYEKKG